MKTNEAPDGERFGELIAARFDLWIVARSADPAQPYRLAEILRAAPFVERIEVMSPSAQPADARTAESAVQDWRITGAFDAEVTARRLKAAPLDRPVILISADCTPMWSLGWIAQAAARDNAAPLDAGALHRFERAVADEGMPGGFAVVTRNADGEPNVHHVPEHAVIAPWNIGGIWTEFYDDHAPSIASQRASIIRNLAPEAIGLRQLFKARLRGFERPAQRHTTDGAALKTSLATFEAIGRYGVPGRPKAGKNWRYGAGGLEWNTRRALVAVSLGGLNLATALDVLERRFWHTYCCFGTLPTTPDDRRRELMAQLTPSHAKAMDHGRSDIAASIFNAVCDRTSLIGIDPRKDYPLARHLRDDPNIDAVVVMGPMCRAFAETVGISTRDLARQPETHVASYHQFLSDNMHHLRDWLDRKQILPRAILALRPPDPAIAWDDIDWGVLTAYDDLHQRQKTDATSARAPWRAELGDLPELVDWRMQSEIRDDLALDERLDALLRDRGLLTPRDRLGLQPADVVAIPVRSNVSRGVSAHANLADNA